MLSTGRKKSNECTYPTTLSTESRYTTILDKPEEINSCLNSSIGAPISKARISVRGTMHSRAFTSRKSSALRKILISLSIWERRSVSRFSICCSM